MNARRRSERVVVPLHIRKLSNWALPLDDFFNLDFVGAPEFPTGEKLGDDDKAIRVLKFLPKDNELRDLHEKLVLHDRMTEAKQLARLINMRWHSVNLLENIGRFDVLDECDPV